MSITVLHDAPDAYSAEVVSAALGRSFGRGEAFRPGSFGVMVNPGDESVGALRELLSGGGKALVFGRVGDAVAGELGLRVTGGPEIYADRADAVVDANEPFNVSPLAVRYRDDVPLGRASPLRTRPLCRYDFTDEWNNLGYGRIRADGGPWSLACAAECDGAEPVAWLADAGGARVGAYATLTDRANGSALWFNRPVGPVDSLEWCVVEAFVAEHREGELPCAAALGELPPGCAGVVIPRLDCDQAVGSARPLFELYASRGLPLSLAVLTGLPMGADDVKLLGEVVSAGGSVVSHSVSHQPDWGGSYEAALAEATESAEWIERQVPAARPVRHGVSPFHRNPLFAVQALADAGYRGFVGGIIHNDPELLLGRAGRPPFVRGDIVTHSQQCMLHGDCYHRQGDAVDVQRESFDHHLAAGAAFGYVDHPFSDAYQYGWRSEAERIGAHAAMIDHLTSFDDVRWLSLAAYLDWLADARAGSPASKG